MNASGEWIHDRFTICLVGATLLHVGVVFGVAFKFDFTTPPAIVETLDVVLVNWRSEEAPDDPDYLAQAAQKGGGDSEEKSRPSQPLSGVLPTTDPGEDVMQAEEVRPEEQELARETIALESQFVNAAEVNLNETDADIDPTAAQLMRESMQMADLQPELSRHSRSPSRLKKRKFISANTQAYKFASYMSAWVSKVERVGNLNYPTELRQRRLHGDLVLTVGIRHDGSVERIDVMRSSGRPEIDRAAMDIVRLAAPYAPLPENIREEVDVLHITRTWRFESAFDVN